MTQVYNDRTARSEALDQAVKLAHHNVSGYNVTGGSGTRETAETTVARAQMFYEFLIEKNVIEVEQDLGAGI